MKNSIIAQIEKQQAAKVAELNKKQGELIKQPNERTIPKIQVGDTVDVHFWIELGEKGRTQVFNGTVSNPSLAAAKCSTIQSGLLGSHIATESPVRRPRPARPAANSPERRSSSR